LALELIVWPLIRPEVIVPLVDRLLVPRPIVPVPELRLRAPAPVVEIARFCPEADWIVAAPAVPKVRAEPVKVLVLMVPPPVVRLPLAPTTLNLDEVMFRVSRAEPRFMVSAVVLLVPRLMVLPAVPVPRLIVLALLPVPRLTAPVVPESKLAALLVVDWIDTVDPPVIDRPAVDRILGVVMLVATPRVPVRLAVLSISWPFIVPETVRLPEDTARLPVVTVRPALAVVSPATVSVPVKLALELIVWPLIRPEVIVPMFTKLPLASILWVPPAAPVLMPVVPLRLVPWIVLEPLTAPVRMMPPLPA
jgi:hypothetical protein